MSEFDRDRVRDVMLEPDSMSNPTEPFDPEADQTWYTNREEFVRSVEDTGSTVIGSTSCDMRDILVLCESRGWKVRPEAGGVYTVVADE